MLDFKNYLPPVDYDVESYYITQKNGITQNEKGKYIINPVELTDFLSNRFHCYTFHEMFYFYNYELGIYQKISWAHVKRIIRCYLRTVFPHVPYLTVSNALFDEFKLAIDVEDDNEPDARYLVFSNCTYDLAQRKKLEHSPKYKARNYIPHNYTEKSDCPIFDNALCTIFKNDTTVIENFWEMLGGILYFGTDYPLKKIFVFMGTGSNGKSLLLDVIRQIVGKDNYSCSRLDEISSDFGSSTFYEKMVNLSPETELRTPANTALLKSITGGDPVVTHFKHQTPFTARHFTKFIIATNNWFPMTDSSDGIFDRLHIFHFTQRFAVSPTQEELTNGVLKADTALLSKIEPEIPSIINKALTAQFRLKDNKWAMTSSPTCQNTNRMIQAAYDPFTAFCKKHIRVVPGSRVKRSEMAQAFYEFQLKVQLGNTYTVLSKQVVLKELLHKLNQLYPNAGIIYHKISDYYVLNIELV